MNTDLVTQVYNIQQLYRHRQDLADHPSITLDEANVHHTQCAGLPRHLQLAQEQLEQQVTDMTATIDQERLLEARDMPTINDQPQLRLHAY